MTVFGERWIPAFAGMTLWVCVMASVFAVLPASGQNPTDPRALWDQATIYRDEWGVPHIQADNLRALAFAFGYAQADDHIGAMLEAYRVADGRAAEVFGEAFANSDEFSLKMGHLEAATTAYPYADPITRDLCEGFALGVNTWLVDHPGKGPEWADGVRPEEVLALMHCYLLSFAPFDLPEVWGRAPAATTGNAWALAPSRTTTGEAILAINPHTDYRGPFQWYEAQLTVGEYNVAGATLFGIPIIMQGHNATLGWGLTPNFADFADVYMEPGGAAPPEDTDNPAAILMNRDTIRYMQLVANSRTFYVRQPGGLEERQVPYLDTPRGPILGKHRGRFCTYQVGGYRDFGALRQLFQMGNASSLAQFQEALALHQLPCFHVVYADRAGNIFYLYNSKVGDKYWPGPVPAAWLAQTAGGGQGEPNTSAVTVNWSLPVPGENPTFQWGPTVPVGALPSLTNPASGYVQACGNPPWRASERTDMSEADWPGWFARDVDSFRAQRVRRLLALGVRSFRDVQAMLYDVLVPVALYGVPWLKRTADENADWVVNAHPDLPAALDTLYNWNYVAETNSPGMTFFHLWWAAFCAASPQLNDVQRVEAIARNTTEVQELSLGAALEATRLMRNDFQSLSVPWGDVHTFVRGDTTLPAPGTGLGDCIFVASDDVFENGAWRVTYGYGFAMVVSFGAEGTKSVSMVPFGASENPESPHFADQLELLKERRMKFVRFEPEEVRRTAKSGFGSVVHLAPPGMEARCTVYARGPVSVSSSVYTQPPAALPLGLATFTVYAQIEQEPLTTPSTVDLEVYVAPELCSPEHLNRLAVYAYDSTNGWTRLEAQTVNPQTRTITGRDRGPRVYAVLGPAEYRVAPDGQTRAMIAQTIPDGSARLELPQASPLVNDAPTPAEVPGPSPGTAQGSPEAPASQLLQMPAPAPVAPPHASASRARQGAIAWGKHLQLRPPDVNGLVELSADAPFGARLIASPDPPEPIPGDLAAFTEFVSTECSSKDGGVNLKINLRVEPGVCADEDVNKLAVYVFDSALGWTALKNQTCDAATRKFTAEDTNPRTYAILGPRQLLLKAPGTSADAAPDVSG